MTQMTQVIEVAQVIEPLMVVGMEMAVFRVVMEIHQLDLEVVELEVIQKRLEMVPVLAMIAVVVAVASY